MSTAPVTALGQEAIEVPRADPGDMRMWSVTTIIGVLDKPAITYWACEAAAKAAVASADVLSARIAAEGPGNVIKWLRDARFRPNRYQLSDTGLGKVVHAACESYALTGQRPADGELALLVRLQGGDHFESEGVVAEVAVVNTMLDRFDEWLQQFQPVYTATEVVVYNLTYGYAGQADAYMILAGRAVIADYKTTRNPRDSQGRPKTPYPEAGLQLGAYRYAERAAIWRPRRTPGSQREYLLSEAERDIAVPAPEVDGGVVIHITPERCQAFPVRCDTRVWETFLYVQEASRWVFDLSKDVIGDALVVAP